MAIDVDMNAAYLPSEDVVAREIEGELLIIPIISGIGDMEDTLFTLNETAKAIWSRLDGKKKLKNIVKELSSEYEESIGEIEEDVRGLIKELLKRRIIVDVTKI